MTGDVKVSVVMPVYNAARYLEKTLSYVTGQTLQEIEIICVDDGSTDDSAIIVEKAAQADARIRLLHQSNQYAGVARNHGMQYASGKYIIFWDADDIFAPEALEHLYQRAEQTRADICVCGAERIDEPTGKRYTSDAYLRTDLLPEQEVFNRRDIPETIFNFATNVPWNKLFRRAFIETHGLQFQAIRQANDTYFMIMTLYYAERITILDEKLISYRTNGEGSLSGKASETVLCAYESYVYTLEDLRKQTDYELVKKSFINRVISGFYHALNIQNSFETYRQFYDVLVSEGFERFGMTELTEEDYLQHWYYRDMKKMMTMSAEDFLVQKSKTRRINSEKQKAEIEKLRLRLSRKNAQIQKKKEVIHSLRSENHELKALTDTKDDVTGISKGEISSEAKKAEILSGADKKGFRQNPDTGRNTMDVGNSGDLKNIQINKAASKATGEMTEYVGRKDHKKRLLMRGAISPLDSPPSLQDVIAKNLIGTNSGNLLYAFAVYRTLMTEDVEIDMDHYDCEGGRWTDEDIKYINATYDAYIVPLADAFRPDFHTKLNRYARAFRKLTIPSYVIGVGLRALYEPRLKEGFPFDDAVKNFMRAATENGGIVGLRGEITAEYLKGLGFMPETDYTVIGCPSMYACGRNLTQKPLQLTKDARISVNYERTTEDEVARFLCKIAMQSEGGQFVGQDTSDLAAYYIGRNYTEAIENSCYPASLTHELFQKDKVRFFVTALGWFENMKTMDLSVGTRLHGNVAALLGGTPAVFLPHDARTRELTEYHAMAQIPVHMITEETCLSDIVEKVDVRSYLRSHTRNFDHFVDFLNEIGLDHIYSENRDRRDAPLDGYIAQYASEEPIKSALFCPREELVARVVSYQEMRTNYQIRQTEHRLKDKNRQMENEYQRKLTDLDRKVEELEKNQRKRHWQRG